MSPSRTFVLFSSCWCLGQPALAERFQRSARWLLHPRTMYHRTNIDSNQVYIAPRTRQVHNQNCNVAALPWHYNMYRKKLHHASMLPLVKMPLPQQELHMSTQTRSSIAVSWSLISSYRTLADGTLLLTLLPGMYFGKYHRSFPYLGEGPPYI